MPQGKRGANQMLCKPAPAPYLGCMKTRSLLCLAVAFTFWALPAGSHPHIFVDAGLRLVRGPDGALSEVEVTWRYDALYSLLLIEDYGLDPDHDLVLTQDEITGMLGFDLNWGGGFEGGLALRQEGVDLALGRPEPVSMALLDTGQIQTTHRRAVLGARPTGPIEAQIYDPEFYVAFEMILATDLSAAPGCSAELVRADLDAAYAILEAAIRDIGGAVAAEDNFPPVGAHFADRLVIACQE